jgi:hypothetical protein
MIPLSELLSDFDREVAAIRERIAAGHAVGMETEGGREEGYRRVRVKIDDGREVVVWSVDWVGQVT